MIWMDMTLENDPPKVVEFTLGLLNVGSFGHLRAPFTRTYAFKYWGLLFDYHHMLFSPNSTTSRAFVDLNVLEDVLNGLWVNTTDNVSQRPHVLSFQATNRSSIRDNINDINFPQNRSKGNDGIPLFWHIPKSGGTSELLKQVLLLLYSQKFILPTFN